MSSTTNPTKAYPTIPLLCKSVLVRQILRTVESLQSHCIHTEFHCSVVHPFASRHEGPRFNPRGILTVCETGILLFASSRYIGDPDVIDHCGLI